MNALQRPLLVKNGCDVITLASPPGVLTGRSSAVPTWLLLANLDKFWSSGTESPPEFVVKKDFRCLSNMAQCVQSVQEFIQDSFVPMVAVLSSQEAETVSRKNNLNFAELLRPFCRLTSEGMNDCSLSNPFLKESQENLCCMAWLDSNQVGSYVYCLFASRY